ncbi:MAG TPA: hypothetical protein VFV78_07975 [Vicinamibacterales bacterium]|nr:hypothetical protein [Vicinamibacterales bacterium]
MLKVRTSLLIGALMLAPSFVLAQTPKPTPTAKPAAATHSWTGTVKSVDATSLTITRPSGSVKEMTFVLNDSTKKQGAIATGASVEVRYKTEGKQNIATAVTVQTKKK